VPAGQGTRTFCDPATTSSGRRRKILGITLAAKGKSDATRRAEFVVALEETPMLVNTAAEREWAATPYPGIERALFRNNEGGGRSSLVRLAAGARFPRHAHHGSEEVVVMAGEVRIGGVALAAGDYLFTAPGEEHDVVALTDAVIFVSSQKATPVVE
jgi:quercetin dioxygenase-like cupin family protein